MSPRRAYTLIEMVIVITLVTLVLATVAALLGSVMRSNRAALSHRDWIRSVQRLAMQFRDDVHAARSARPADGKLSLSLPNGETVVYAATDESIQRTVESDDIVAQRDSFDLPSAAIARFEVVPSGDGHLASLLVTYPLDPMQAEFSDRRTLRIDACTARSPAPRGSDLPRRSALPTTE
ncbi:MAG: prepilin-type N-terminal cleavage/methylation domain-containing protein [Pirellulales bacterium]|nr:prepilin-type N-terminal cleavage/methylation domain-containing protein [Pirellulales bacterium]